MVCDAGEPSLSIWGEIQTMFIHSVNNSSQERAEIVFQEDLTVVFLVIKRAIKVQDFINKAFPSSFAEIKTVPQQVSDPPHTPRHLEFILGLLVDNLAGHRFHLQGKFY